MAYFCRKYLTGIECIKIFTFFAHNIFALKTMHTKVPPIDNHSVSIVNTQIQNQALLPDQMPKYAWRQTFGLLFTTVFICRVVTARNLSWMYGPFSEHILVPSIRWCISKEPVLLSDSSMFSRREKVGSQSVFLSCYSFVIPPNYQISCLFILR